MAFCCAKEPPTNCGNCSPRALACRAGLTTRRLPENCSVMIRPKSLTLSKRLSAQAHLPPISVARSLTRQRSGWHPSATRMNNQTGKRRHVFTSANGLNQMLNRIGHSETDGYVMGVRGVLHGAMALYLARYLNVPAARMPGESDQRLDAMIIQTALLDAFVRQRQVDLAARLVARYLTFGHSPQALIAALARALLREDGGFYAYQMLEGGVRQFTAWGDS